MNLSCPTGANGLIGKRTDGNHTSDIVLRGRYILQDTIRYRGTMDRMFTFPQNRPVELLTQSDIYV